MRALWPIVAAVLLAGCGTAVAPQPETAPAGPGWRWESYAGIELQVPADYGWQTTGSPLYPAWCAGTPHEGPPRAGVNRAHGAVMPAIGCPPDRPTGTYAPAVDLGARVDRAPVDHGGGWVSQSVEVAGVPVTVSDHDATRRQRILASVRRVGEVDAHGCPPDTALREPGARPSTGPLPATADVTGAAVCRYLLPTGFADLPDLPGRILSSSRLETDQARQLVAAVRAAPEGTGPNSPANCAEQVMLGEEMVVLRFATADGAREVTLRYAGCAGHGTDDGQVTRRLTAEVLHLVLGDRHRPSVLSGDVARLLPTG